MKPSKERDSLHWNLIAWCNDNNLKLETEYKFHPKRKWRADFAIPDVKLLIEFEGIMSQKSRHTSVVGYSKDCEKYNAASTLGFRVLRYTVLNYRTMHDNLSEYADHIGLTNEN